LNCPESQWQASDQLAVRCEQAVVLVLIAIRRGNRDTGAWGDVSNGEVLTGRLLNRAPCLKKYLLGRVIH
jgi:hypothetical protein